MGVMCAHQSCVRLSNWCVDRNDDGAERHEHRANRGTEDEPSRLQHAGGERDRHDVVARGPPEVLNHLAVRRARKRDDPGDVARRPRWPVPPVRGFTLRERLRVA